MKYILILILASNILADPYWERIRNDAVFESRVKSLVLYFQKDQKEIKFELSLSPIRMYSSQVILFPDQYETSVYHNNIEKKLNDKSNITFFGGKNSILLLNHKQNNEEMDLIVCPVEHNGVVSDDSIWLNSKGFKLSKIGLGIHGQATFKLNTGSGYGINFIKDYILLNNKNTDLSEDVLESKFPRVVIRNNKTYKEFTDISANNSIKYEIMGETTDSIGINNKYLISDQYQMTVVKMPEVNFEFNSNKYIFLENNCWNISRKYILEHLRKEIKDFIVPSKRTIK